MLNPFTLIPLTQLRVKFHNTTVLFTFLSGAKARVVPVTQDGSAFPQAEGGGTWADAKPRLHSGTRGRNRGAYVSCKKRQMSQEKPRRDCNALICLFHVKHYGVANKG